MKNFKEISNLIKISQTIEYNIMDWMNYYNHYHINKINVKEFNDAGHLVINISFADKDWVQTLESLTVGIHKNDLTKYENYEYLLNDLFSKFVKTPYKYAEKYGLNYNEIFIKGLEVIKKC